MKRRFAFTLIELLVVIGIIAALTAVVFVAIDPAKRFRDSRNARRMTDVDTILAAIHQYIVDEGGAVPSGIGISASQIGTCITGGNNLCVGATTACVDLTTVLGNGKYLKINPIDQQNGSEETTGYSVSRDSNNMYTVTSCSAEGTIIRGYR
ncbi:MAG: type II secretion system protein [Candidatus Shapirobacteria bacterium]